jgi:two-component system chemotaxis response regulator CheB
MVIAAASGPSDVIRVMIVDDSVFVRGLAARWIAEEDGVEVVASCRSGLQAISSFAAARPDVVILDVEMPDMDGVEALPLLLAAKPGLAVVMNSSFTTHGADLSLRCLALGAADVLAKPSRASGSPDEYRRDLMAKVRALGTAARRRAGQGLVAAPKDVARAPHHKPSPTPAAAPAVRVARSAGAQIRAIAIGSSTGGPQALAEVLKALKPATAYAPIVIVQHMPAGFTATLAKHLTETSGFPVREASDGDPILSGTAYVAPGGRHFSLDLDGSRAVARVEDGEPINFCKPSVDPLFRSAERIFKSGLAAVVLTGMGSDGASAVPSIAASGGRVIAQDEASSVVWGMPGAAVATGACAEVLPLKEIGPWLVRETLRGRR